MSYGAEYEKYKRYLDSPEWREKRRQRLIIDGQQCQICGARTKLNVHHVTYDNLYNEDVNADLITLCERCHFETETDVRERDKLRHEKVYAHRVRLDAEKESWFGASNIMAALFIVYAWGKDTMNGGSWNLSDYKDLKKLQRDFETTYKLDEYPHFNTQIIHDGIVQCKRAMVDEMLADGIEIPEIRKRTGLSESTIRKREKRIFQ